MNASDLKVTADVVSQSNRKNTETTTRKFLNLGTRIAIDHS